MKEIKLDEIEYEILENYKDAIDIEELKEKFTDYFYPYDYILGDYSYSKLRLKGFCDKKNSLYKKINNYQNIEEYIKKNCAYECKYFILKKKIHE